MTILLSPLALDSQQPIATMLSERIYPMEYIKVYKRHTEKAGWYYTNIVRKVVSVFGLEATYQAGNSNGQKPHYWFINDDTDGQALPNQAMATLEGDIISNEDYASLAQPTAVEASEDDREQPTSF
jgi:hypothetical protein